MGKLAKGKSTFLRELGDLADSYREMKLSDAKQADKLLDPFGIWIAFAVQAICDDKKNLAHKLQMIERAWEINCENKEK